jgi:hypothetical protein
MKVIFVRNSSISIDFRKLGLIESSCRIASSPNLGIDAPLISGKNFHGHTTTFWLSHKNEHLELWCYLPNIVKSNFNNMLQVRNGNIKRLPSQAEWTTFMVHPASRCHNRPPLYFFRMSERNSVKRFQDFLSAAS